MKIKRWTQKAVDREEWAPVVKEAKALRGRQCQNVSTRRFLELIESDTAHLTSTRRAKNLSGSARFQAFWAVYLSLRSSGKWRRVIGCLEIDASRQPCALNFKAPTVQGLLTFWSLTTYIYIYIYIYVSYRSANLQTLHFKYLSNKYTYWIF